MVISQPMNVVWELKPILEDDAVHWRNSVMGVPSSVLHFWVWAQGY
jgi:hypothetical protein